jgi:hypothetical protein
MEGNRGDNVGRTKGRKKEGVMGKEEGLRRRGGSARGQGGRAKVARRKG